MNDLILNISIEAICVAILLVLISCQRMSTDRRAKVNRYFLAVLCLMLSMLLIDIITWLIDEKPGSFYFFIANAFNFLVYALSAVINLVFVAYIAESIPLEKHVRKAAYWVAGANTAVYLGLLVASMFNGIIFSVDENNLFHWGDYYWIAHVNANICYFVILAAVIHYRKKLGLYATLSYASYAVIPLVADLFNIYFYQVSIAWPAMTIAMLIVFVNIQMQREKRMQEQELALSESKTAIMLSQIQPHFLYNALDAISNIYDENEEATRALKTFSQYMRGNLDSLSQRGLIPLEKELGHIRQYLTLEKLRFEERLQVEYDLKSQGFMLPSLTLQPIVENAVRHGVTKQRKGGTVWIRTEETEHSYRITVEDNGVGFDPAAPRQDGRSHTGITNVHNRLAAMCGGRLTVESMPGKGTTAVIEIPKKRSKRS